MICMETVFTIFLCLLKELDISVLEIAFFHSA